MKKAQRTDCSLANPKLLKIMRQDPQNDEIALKIMRLKNKNNNNVMFFLFALWLLRPLGCTLVTFLSFSLQPRELETAFV